MSTPAPFPSLTLIVQFQYRGNPQEEWSQTFHFGGGDPADDAAWKTMADAAILSFKTCIDSANTIVRAIGHNGGEAIAAWTYDYLAAGEQTVGTFAPITGENEMPGDVAGTVRVTTDAKSTKGKPIYLRKYFHGVWSFATGADKYDKWSAGQLAACQSYLEDWITGFSDGNENHSYTGPKGAHGLQALGNQYLTTRTLKRRGKRPTSPT